MNGWGFPFFKKGVIYIIFLSMFLIAFGVIAVLISGNVNMEIVGIPLIVLGIVLLSSAIVYSRR